MFRRMRRFNQQLSEEDCIAVLKTERRGVLSMIGDGGYPYGIPMNHWTARRMGKSTSTVRKAATRSMRSRNAAK